MYRDILSTEGRMTSKLSNSPVPRLGNCLTSVGQKLKGIKCQGLKNHLVVSKLKDETGRQD